MVDRIAVQTNCDLTFVAGDFVDIPSRKCVLFRCNRFQPLPLETGVPAVRERVTAMPPGVVSPSAVEAEVSCVPEFRITAYDGEKLALRLSDDDA